MKPAALPETMREAHTEARAWAKAYGLPLASAPGPRVPAWVMEAWRLATAPDFRTGGSR